MLRKKSLLIAALLLITGFAVLSLYKGSDNTRQSNSADIGGPFTLTNQDGKQVTEKDYKGKWMLVFFGFTNCPDVCPTGVLAATEALALLGSDGNAIQPILISLDPGRDSPALLKEYLSHFSPRWQGLVGTSVQVNAAASAYRVYHSKQELPESEAGYTINHSGFIYLMGPDGNYRAHFRHSDTPQQIADGIRQALKAE